MNAKVEQYIAQQREQIEQEKRKQQQTLLASLGIYEEEKEYAGEAFSNFSMAARMGYCYSETVDGTVKFYKSKKVYPQLTDEEYEALLAVQREKEALGLTEQNRQSNVQEPAPVPAEPSAYHVSSELVASESFGGRLMKILAWFVWIGGLIASFVLGRLPDHYGDLKFNFWLFLAYVAGFFVVGATYWAIGELFDNVAEINSGIVSLNHAKIKPEK